MKQLIAVVHKDEGSVYGVHFPDAPGCFSAAETLDEVVARASEALSLFFEDQEVPEPSSLERIRELAAEDIEAGAMLVAVPLIVPAGHQARVNISLDRGVLAAIDSAARSRRMTRSAFLAQAARNEIEGRH